MESEWAGRLRQIRRQHRLTQEALASELEVSQALISRWESGEIVPGRTNREKLARYLEDPRHVSPYRRLRLMTQLNPSFSALLERSGKSLILTEVSEGLRQNALAMRAVTCWTGNAHVQAVSVGGAHRPCLVALGVFSGDVAYGQVYWSLDPESMMPSYWMGQVVPVINDQDQWAAHMQVQVLSEEEFKLAQSQCECSGANMHSYSDAMAQLKDEGVGLLNHAVNG